MAGKAPVRFSVRRAADPDFTAVVLSHDGGGDPRRAMEAWIVPAYGSNLCRFRVGGSSVIDFDRQLLLARDFTGTPVLYPTPNRVRGGVFRWEGESYRQCKGGRPVLEHGLAHSEPWQEAGPVAEERGARLETWLEFREGAAVFESFPFPHRLSLEFLLGPRGVTVTYRIRNLGSREIPFGFGLHPYFMKLSGDSGTWVSLPAWSVMDATSDLLPTGKLTPVVGTVYDLRKPVPVGSLDLDHVFTGIRRGRHARIQLRTAGMQIHLEATRDFSHLVLYTPRGERFFCLENQTCSTDAHNLFDRGFAVESGLKTVKPGAEHSGSVTYAIEFE
jgi:aldose 1-epimerase